VNPDIYYYVDLKRTGRRVYKIFNKSSMYQVSTCGTYSICMKGTSMNESGMDDLIEKNQVEYNKMVKEF